MKKDEIECPKCGAKNPIYRKLSDTYICRSENCEFEFELEPKEPLKPIITLTFFDPKYGASIYYTYPEDIQDKDSLKQIAEMINHHYSDSCVYKFNEINSINYNFQIYSSWYRGGLEFLMVSVVFNSPTTPETEQIVLSLCREFSEKLKTNEETFKGLHINDLDKYYNKTKEDIIKNNALIKLWIKELYLEIRGEKNAIYGTKNK